MTPPRRGRNTSVLADRPSCLGEAALIVDDKCDFPALAVFDAFELRRSVPEFPRHDRRDFTPLQLYQFLV